MEKKVCHDTSIDGTGCVMAHLLLDEIGSLKMTENNLNILFSLAFVRKAFAVSFLQKME